MSNGIIKDAFARHLAAAKESADSVAESVQKAADVLLAAVRSGKKALICGNGGSAADAQRFAGELVCKYKNDRRPLPAIALTADVSALTAIGNDYGFEKIFARQVEALGGPGDVLVAITTSGKSPNVLAAIAAAKDKKMKVLVFSGVNGSAVASGADAAVLVPSEETSRIQEIHELAIHSICEYIDANI